MIRKGMHQTIGTAAALRKYHVLEESEARRLMSRLLQDSEDLADHIRKLVIYASELIFASLTGHNYRTVGSVILSISHGYAVEQDGKDPLVTLADECLAEASLAFQPGSWAVDLIPACKF